MSVLLVLLIALVLAGILVALGYSMHLFRIEKTDPVDLARSLQNVDFSGDFPQDFSGDEIPGEEQQEEEEDPFSVLLQGDLFAEPEEEESLTDKVDLFTYFGEEEEGEGEGEVKADEAEPEFDRLSNLKSGRGYILDCQQALTHAGEEDIMYAAAYFDIDRFRFINSLKGYSIGDYILTNIAQEIQGLFPEHTLYSRVSADHFAAVFPILGDSVLSEYSESLKRICEKIRVDVGLKSNLRICMGLAITESKESDYDARVLLQKANIARHCLKTSRTDSYQMFDDVMISSYLYGESALEDYSENQYGDEILLYYQSQLDMSRNRVISCDVLARWVCEDEANKEVLATPENGRLATNGCKVIYQACREMSRWRKGGKEVLPAYLPMSPLDLFKEDIDEFLGKCISDFQLEPHMVHIVVDLATLKLNGTVAAGQIAKMRDIGVKVGIGGIDVTDAGLGFLVEVVVDFIKLNRSVVSGVGNDSGHEAIIERILNAAADHRVTALFEGVDSQEQMNLLSELGVTCVQGRYAGAPRQAEDYMESLPERFQQREQYNQEQKSTGTVILDDRAMQQGEFHVY